MTPIININATYTDTTFQHLEQPSETFEKIIFENCKFNHCGFSSAKFIQCKFIDCDFLNCNLSAIVIDGSSFSQVYFRDSKIIGVNWAAARWPQIKLTSPIHFEQCNISLSNFYGLSLIEITIDSCKAHEVDFREADLSRANFANSDLYNSQFIHTKLNYADFSEAVNYSINIGLNQIEKAKFTFPEVIGLLANLDIEISGINS